MSRRLRQLLWSGPSVQRLLNAGGLHVVPANFYSNIPTVNDVLASFEYDGRAAPYTAVFDREYLGEFLDRLLPFAAEFDPPQEGDPSAPDGYFWKNPAFSFSDAMSYYAMLRLLRPARVVEVGSGFSTLVANEAIERNGTGEIVVVEPYPQPFLEKLSRVREVIRKPVQQVPVGFFVDELNDGDVLFIDSTHTVKIGSDCLYLYLQVLPAIQAAVTIHAHDVFLPEPMPQAWALEKHIYWTEQYLLYALLLENPSMRVCFGSNYNRLYHGDRMGDFMGGKAKPGGGSIWFQRIPQPKGLKSAEDTRDSERAEDRVHRGRS